ncbi:hypothetical protein BY996DRAFT_6412713 [Phakopsora pachyrhizi]|nr:hypothetical protein BY996DRAFT_6412713 [Phakopsora pachyrhizi]
MVENLELEDKVEALRQRLMSDVSSNSAGSFIAQSQSSPSVCRIPSMESVIDPMFFHLPSLPRAMTTAPMMRQIPHPFNFFLNTVPPDESVDENDEYSFGVDSYTTGVGQFEWSFEPEDSISTISSTFDFRPSTPSPLKQLYMSSFQQPQTSPHRHLFAC